MKDSFDITFGDVRDILIKINPIAKWYPSIMHGFITAEACKIYNMAVMYTANTVNSYNIDFMDIHDIREDVRPGSIISTTLDLSNQFETPTFCLYSSSSCFILKGLVFENNGKYIEKTFTYPMDSTLMNTECLDDIHKLYHKWRNFMIDIVKEFNNT